MLKILIFIFFYLVNWTVYAKDSPSGTVPKKIIRHIDKFIQVQLEQKKIIGCSVAIVDHGKIIFIKSYGVLKKGEKKKVNNKTLFQLGSVSKPITATLVARLVKEKYLTLEDPVRNFGLSIEPTTTLRHLLSHTTGYDRKHWNQKIEQGISHALLIKDLTSIPPVPGKIFNYHNVAFSMIEDVVSFVMKDSFSAVLKEKVFAPLQMTATQSGQTNYKNLLNAAWPHQKNSKNILYASKNYSIYYHKNANAAGGVNSTIKDMAIFLQAQLGYKPEFLTAEDLKPFHTREVEAPDALNWIKTTRALESYYGLGWRIVQYGQEEILFHGGWLKGFRNFLGIIPKRKLGIVILNNSETRFALDLGFTFFDLVSAS